MTLDSKAIVGEAVDLLSHVNCIHCDVMLPEFSRFCLLCGAAQFELVPASMPASPQAEPEPEAEPEQPVAAQSLADALPVQAAVHQPIEQAPEVLYVDPPPKPAVGEPSPWEKIKSMQKMADAKLSLMESDRHWAKKLVQK